NVVLLLVRHACSSASVWSGCAWAFGAASRPSISSICRETLSSVRLQYSTRPAASAYSLTDSARVVSSLCILVRMSSRRVIPSSNVLGAFIGLLHCCDQALGPAVRGDQADGLPCRQLAGLPDRPVGARHHGVAP